MHTYQSWYMYIYIHIHIYMAHIKKDTARIRVFYSEEFSHLNSTAGKPVLSSAQGKNTTTPSTYISSNLNVTSFRQFLGRTMDSSRRT